MSSWVRTTATLASKVRDVSTSAIAVASKKLDLASKSSITFSMNSKHRKTLEALRSKPERGDIAWAAVEALLLGIGCRKLEGEGSRVRFVSPDGTILRIQRPHPRPVLDKGAVKSVRRFLDQMEIEE